MKKLYLFPISLLFSFCNSSKKIEPSKLDEKFTSIVLESACPSDGTCTIELFKNKSISLKTDTIGQLYYNLLESEATSVIVFQYNRLAEAGLQDGNYQEELLFEIQNSTESISLVDIQLQKVKMIFGRHCYCKAQTGIFPIEKGNFQFQRKDNVYQINLGFKNSNVPQIISTINCKIQ